MNLAFSDSDQGWSYYSCGYLRHDSGGDGPIYGESYGGGDTIGVYCDLIDGRIFFSKNSIVFPEAFSSPKLLQTVLFPACSLFLENESFEVMNPLPED